ncbi:hypothetical protein [Reichenbachiella versicolor]|uniref:hypothetical protein n=1 Tax=Reichenbachiella versicolor TaxID=1821036 RepID=UPI000D6E2976|nr:hypothetical protein [Reichenbachiella versicolor]
MITEGYEHRMFFQLISLGIPKGAEFVSEDTHRRQAYLQNNPHFPNNTVLIASMTYCENVLNDSDINSNKWIEDYGGTLIEVLKSMKIVRNAWTHNSGDISRNNRFNGMSGAEQYNYVKVNFQSNDADNRSYEFNDDLTVVNVLPAGCGRIRAVCTKVFKNAGQIVVS